MRKVYFILGSALVVISVCMVVIVSRGVSLRTEPIIKPSPIDQKNENIVYGVTHRLFPEFQKADYVIWGLDLATSSEEHELFKLLLSRYSNRFKSQVNTLTVNALTSPEQIQSCLNPCWYVVGKDQAHSLAPNSVVDLIQAQRGVNYFSITFLDFSRDITVPEICEDQHRLSFECIMPISVREARRFLKKVEARSFFMRRYNTVDYFLFSENLQ